MDARRVESVVEQLRRGSSVALAGAVGHDATATLERELTALGRTTIWIDLDGAESGAELGGRIVEGCMHHLDPEALGDVLERLPTRGRIDLEAFAELLMLPERIAESSGKRVVAILEGFQQVERVIGFVGLSAVRDALILRDRVSYLFVGGRRLEALFSRPDMPLYGLAEVEVVGDEKGGRRRDRRRQPAPPAPEAPPPSDDPLTSALLAWAEPPAKAEPEPTSPAQEAWERLLARESMERDWFERLERDPDEDEGDRWWRRGRRRR